MSTTHPTINKMPSWAQKLSQAIEGDLLFDDFSRGRYSTDASHYQITPIAVVVPKTLQDLHQIVELAREEGLPLLPRGAGTSQCGQTVGEALVIDCARHLNSLLALDRETQSAWVQPGLVLDQLNAQLKDEGLWFPVDVSTGSRATVGGMTGNNSCGARSIRYGTMRDNVLSIDALLADGSRARMGRLPAAGIPEGFDAAQRRLVSELLKLGRDEGAEINARFPQVMRRVGGYNIDTLADNETANLAHLLVGSEGTLALSEAIQIKLAPLPRHKVLGVCHFPSFYQAMASTQEIVKLNPSAVELVDSTMIALARDIAIFEPIVSRFVHGEPEALLLVEFAGEDLRQEEARLAQLSVLMADLGFPDAVVEAREAAFQREIWEVRKSGLNIMMSMKGEGKPISFIEDCAVPLSDLADYTDRLTRLFEKHGTSGTWYAHASVGCLHVRPVLNLKLEKDISAMRAIAEEAFSIVREYKGSHSGEHGDGLVRSEFHEVMFGSRMVRNFETVKDLFDPKGLLNPGKIVRPSKIDDRQLFRFKPGYQRQKVDTRFNWQDWGGFAGAVEMCNNNGACRKVSGGVMCPSYRATRDESHVTRGRANVLRLALSGQLGPDALTSDAMADSLKLCLACKACKRECPTGVDMARMKMEVAYQRGLERGWSRKDRLIGSLPRQGDRLSRVAPLLNLRNRNKTLAALGEKLFGLDRNRVLPAWRSDVFDGHGISFGPQDGPEVLLLADTFNRFFEKENIEAAIRVLVAAGYRVQMAPSPEGRPLCCGRTYLSVGLLDEAIEEAQRTLVSLRPWLERGVPLLGLEPSCLLSFRDEIPNLLGDMAGSLAENSFLVTEFLAKQIDLGTLDLPWPIESKPHSCAVHGHCHQKAHSIDQAGARLLEQRPDTEVTRLATGCCGMAGSFGYDKDTAATSRAVAEGDLLPALAKLPAETSVAAEGFSCRHQITELSGRTARHPIALLTESLDLQGEDL